ncbi:MAG TPA: P-loop NTPase [Vicinamibacteria bacterium]|nr:P-loop NTPase [Vicinamibacteria bacterium]
MSRVTEQDVLSKLEALRDPDLGRDIVSLGSVKNVRICSPIVSCDIELSNPASQARDRLRKEAEAALLSIPGIEEANVRMTWSVSAPPEAAGRVLPSGQQAPAPQRPEGVKNLIAIASGKGGVGKSTVAANLAVALHEAGASVGLCDADVYGPSQGTMFGITQHPQANENKQLVPIESNGIRVMSMGLLTTKETPVIWRGPMATRLVQQFLSGVAWGELDYLLVDLPPGTGDVQLTLTQSVPLTGAVIVTTPQDVARNIAEKGLRMFQPVQVAVLGIIENMSYFLCAHCGERTYIFREGGGMRIAEELGIPFLGGIPIDPEVVISGDEGKPIVVRNPAAPAAAAYREIAARVAAAVAKANYEGAQADRPKEIAADEKSLRIRWSDGSESSFPFQFLRNHCPCAVCVDEWTGERKSLILLLPSNFRPMAMEPVGNYAVQISWSDGHNTGIYSFRYLRELEAESSQPKPS